MASRALGIRSLVCSLAAMACLGPVPAQPADKHSPPTQLEALYDSLSHPVLDEHRAFTLTNISFLRGGQKVVFTSGSLRLFRRVHGKVFGGVFTGSGSVTIAPPTPLEKQEFELRMNEKLVEGVHIFPFQSATLWFQDTLLSELGGLMPKPIEVVRQEKETAEKSMAFAVDKSNQNVIYRLVDEMMDLRPEPYSCVHFIPAQGKELFFTYDPRRYEEVVISTPVIEYLKSSVRWLEVVNSFHLPEEYSAATEYALTSEDKRRYDYRSYSVELWVQKGGRTRARTLLGVHSLELTARTMTFLLDPKLVIDSVTAEDGTPLSYQRNEDAWDVLLQMPDQDSPDYKIRFCYSGDFLRPYEGHAYIGISDVSGWKLLGDTKKLTGQFYELHSLEGWYPLSTDLTHATYDVTYHIPLDMEIVGAGKRVSEFKESGTRTVHNVTSEPTIGCTFSLGYFRPESLRLTEKEPLVTVYVTEGSQPVKIARDIANCIRLYTFLFGGDSLQELRAGLGGLNHGEAFQGYIQLPWVQEEVKTSKSTIELGSAHEVSHSWWGEGVGARSYHDWWIVEAFAEYSSLLYVPFVLKDDAQFFDVLKTRRERLCNLRHYALGSGPPLGSIWLGYRASTTQRPSDYALSIYQKGAWVLHMLRMMLLDLPTMKEDGFKSMMSEFYHTYRGKDASTDDFRQIVNKYFQGDMSWFFDQWVYGTEIPTLKCTHSVSKNPDGKYSVVITIEQKDVSKPFVIYLPIEVLYKDGTTARTRLALNQQKKDFTYLLDREPEKISFNILESVLCKIEE